MEKHKIIKDYQNLGTPHILYLYLAQIKTKKKRVQMNSL